jgi:hypothetical protein
MRRVLAAAAALAALGCKTMSGAPETEPARYSVGAPIDSAWSATLAFYAEHKWKVETADRATGTIVSVRSPLSEADSAAWVKCPKVPPPTLFSSPTQTVQITGVLRTDLHAAGDSTSVKVTLWVSVVDRVAVPANQEGSGLVTNDCPSTGALEAALAARLRGSAKPRS